MNNTKKKGYCVKAAFRRLQEESHKRQDASSSYNCSFCQRKRQQANQQLRERLEAIDQEAKHNRRIREQKEEEYEKTVRLLNLMNRSNK
jgi:wyosine [tRNA(Phe)-imidazoG37] synthetase (radical SAM superfamily)